MVRARILLLLCFLIASAGFAQTEAIDLTAVFRAEGIRIDSLLVYKISDIVLIRGRTSDMDMAARAGRFAKDLGYQRVANLIEIVPELADSAIVRFAGRELDMTRELEGCTFQIQSIAGVVRLTGRVRQEQQVNLAASILRRIDGVKSVHSELVSVRASGAQHD